MDLNKSKKIVFITGATSGIGEAAANILSNNYNLILCGRREERLIEIKNKLSKITEVSLTHTPKGAEPNYSFFNFFLPNEGQAKKVAHHLKAEGVEACFYWYANNWHYYKHWEHLKEQKTLGKLPQEVREQLQNFDKEDFSLSDEWLSRNISTLVKVSWTEEEMKKRAQKIAKAIKAAL